MGRGLEVTMLLLQNLKWSWFGAPTPAKTEILGASYLAGQLTFAARSTYPTSPSRGEPHDFSVPSLAFIHSCALQCGAQRQTHWALS